MTEISPPSPTESRPKKASFSLDSLSPQERGLRIKAVIESLRQHDRPLAVRISFDGPNAEVEVGESTVNEANILDGAPTDLLDAGDEEDVFPRPVPEAQELTD
ncbi:MAG TPA: hypothetical protein VG604_04770 [Candidatus Saccharimonadales bacterium]|nr:hypothetical protein [Candidatus Saccharimonadales bacterium]